jgi:hypothetical protein
MKHRDYMRELLKMSDEAIMQALGTKEFHRDLAQKHVDGAEFLDADGRTVGDLYFCNPRDFYIEKPKTITVTFEMPKPTSVSDGFEDNYFYFYIERKLINFSSEEAYDTFSASFLKAIKEAMQE